jgi:cysteine desulfurase
LVFTCGGTEANNLALHDAPALVVSRLEHPSVLAPAERVERSGKPVVWLPTPESGRLSPDTVAHGLDQLPPGLRRGAVVTVMAANHETGVLQPLEAIAQVVHGVAARLHVDAVQLLGKADHAGLDAADSVTVTAHKLRGPKGIGALLCRGRSPHPLLVGGAQERGLRPGTQDAALALGFRVALTRALEHPELRSHLPALRDDLERRLAEVALPNVRGVPRLGHVSSLSFPGTPGPELAAALDLAGYRVSSGSACSAGTEEPSPVIAAMLGKARASTTLRLSLGEDTDAQAVGGLIGALYRALGRELF